MVPADRSRSLAAAAALVLCLWTSTAAPQPGDEGIPYDTEITGVAGDLRDLIEESSRLLEAEDTPPAGIAGLQQRAESDAEDFQRVLRSQGYYGARIDITVDADQRPARVSIAINTGPQFRLQECTVAYAGPAPDGFPDSCDALQVTIGEPARATMVLDAEARLLQPFLERGYPDAQVGRRAVVDHATSGMILTFTVTTGAAARLGEVTVSGTERTEEEFVAALRTWETGAAYDTRVLDAYRERLNTLDLFDSVILRLGPEMDGLRPVEAAVHERPPRSFGGGVRYATDEGYGLLAYWEHRNFRGAAEHLRTDLRLAEMLQSLSLSYALPHRPNPDQRLEFLARALHENTDAYDRIGGDASAALVTPLTRYWKARFSAAFQTYDIEEIASGNRRTSIIGSLPTDATYDDTASLLDPTGGARFLVRGTPVFGSSGTALFFLRLEGEASGYLDLSDNGRTVLAGRLRLGTILGETVDAVPPDWRFYSGGGGSVRGYGYQNNGPRDAQGNPIGGRSLIEGAVEVRQRIGENFGAVAFLETGSVGRTILGFEEPQHGAGIGIRYYTAFGPIRADIATPLNPRSGDDRIQLYISIGQAF